MDILWLGQPECRDPHLAGGKAANLSLLAASHRVPPGFCLPTRAFDQWTDGVSENATKQPTEVLPPPLDEALVPAYQDLGLRCSVSDPPVAVRSSAVGEDSAGVSFAGQHETFLNIVGIEDVSASVIRCWKSLTAPRALEYRRQHGLPVEGVRMAVLVQQFIQADVSVVVFSANPVTGNRREMVINASWGLGESLVGGTVTPDTYVVRKADLTVVDRQIGQKRRMTVPVSRGVSEVDVPRLLWNREALSDVQIVEMARLAVVLEATMGWPVDLECSYLGGEMHLLQCRPISTLVLG